MVKSAYFRKLVVHCAPGTCLGRLAKQTLQAALSRGFGGELPPAVELVLAGDMHRFQAITFGPSEADTEAPRPPVVVIGTGGVELDPSPPVGAFATEVGGRAAKVLVTGAEVGTPEGGKAAFGYLEVVLGGAGEGWSGRLIDPAEGLTLAHLRLARRGRPRRRLHAGAGRHRRVTAAMRTVSSPRPRSTPAEACR